MSSETVAIESEMAILPDHTPITHQLSDAIAELLFSSFSEATRSLANKLQQKADQEQAEEDAKELAVRPKIELETFDIPHKRNGRFVGRVAAISHLFGMWRPGTKSALAVTGLGGIG